VAGLGGKTHEYTTPNNMDVMTDTGLKNTAKCVDYMRAAGLLNQNRSVADLTIGSDPLERFGDARTLRGLNRSILTGLTADPNDPITTVPALLAMTDVGLMGKRMGPKKRDLLRQALVDSGMPQVYPWPQSEVNGREPALLRSVALLAPALEDLPSWTRKVLAKFLLGIPLTKEIPRGRLPEASEAYDLHRAEVLRIVS
jgi:hypothetical protein